MNIVAPFWQWQRLDVLNAIVACFVAAWSKACGLPLNQCQLWDHATGKSSVIKLAQRLLCETAAENDELPQPST